ncbi:acyltransferase family protein [Hafnia alvei]|uniref:acyltransferase family protein n=1 Tax=Hafnia alvei TaxID=569 RepID=UPI000E07F672|nr:acyltransferase family protein [Hafnia alvei]STQ70194.1 Fucose 4-O-acetylase and related acetyltransferases [Hafnia alvei]
MRDAKLDNIRGFLIILVVLGHLIQVFTVRSNNAFSYVYDIIYSFHMPLFIMICGLLFKPDGFIKRASYVFIIYLIFQCLMMLPFWFKNGITIENTTYPAFSMWFLLSLSCWNVMYFYLKDVPYIFPASLICCLAAGYIQANGYAFSYMRTISFFPFFIFGAKYLSSISTRGFINNKIISILMIIVTLSIYMLYITIIKPDYRVPHLILSYDLNNWFGFADLFYRALFLLFSFSLSVFIFSIFTDKNGIITRIGKHTLPTYIAQAVIIMYAPFLIKSQYNEFSIQLLIIFITISLSISIITGTKTLDSLLRGIPKILISIFKNN